MPIVMEPFSKDDPLYDLLGKARPVEPRPNFTQNVMRDIRNTPQEKLGWWASLLAKFKFEGRSAPAFATAAVAAALLLGFALFEFGPGSSTADPASNPGTTIVSNDHPASAEQVTTTMTMAEAEPQSESGASIAAFEEAGEETPAEAAVASELDSMDQLSDLLASQDTSSLTDGEIAMLLY